MGRIFIIAIVLYLIFLACYLLWERSVKRRMNAARKKGFNPFKSPPKEDIMGKSKFVMRHSAPEATTLKISDKREENTPTFADGNEKKDVPNTPAAIPADELDKVFSSTNSADDSGEIDLVFNDKPEGEESENDEEEIDHEENEEAEEPVGVGLATGLVFDDLSGMVRTVDDPDAATPEEKEEAGRVITEIRKTDMFEQIVSGQPKKRVSVGKLMDDYFAAFYRRQREEAGEGTDKSNVKLPEGFDVRAFASP